MNGLNPNFEYVRSVVKSVAGISLDKGKDYLIENRLAPIASRNGFETIPNLIGELRSEGPGSTVERLVIDALTINETSFFRDQIVFDHLEASVIPQLIQANKATRRIRIWSNACSTGQEIYSIAILLKERFPQLRDWHISLQGTDISDRVLAQAKNGVYSDFELNRGLGPKLQRKYFTQVSEFEWQIKDEISRSVTFSYQNLFDSWASHGTFDIILLRNVLIYFELPEKQSILSKVRKHLTRGGRLFLGSSETTYNIDPSWVSDASGASSFFQKGEEKRSIGL